MRKLATTTILTIGLTLGVIPAANATPAKSHTPKACKVAIRDGNKMLALSGVGLKAGADSMTAEGQVIQALYKAITDPSTVDAATNAVTAATTRISSNTDTINAAKAQLDAITGEYQTARDKCLAGG